MATALRQPQGNVAASAVAGQIATTPAFGFPFSPFALSNAGPHYGLTPGDVYIMRRPQKATSGKAPANDPCLSDQRNVKHGGKSSAEWTDTLLTSSERGYIEVQSRADKRDIIRNDEPSVMVQIGQVVTFTNGTQQSVRNDLLARLQQNTNAGAGSYSEYKSSMNGNVRRVVVIPSNDPTTGGTVVDYGAFFFMPAAGMIGNNRFGAQQTWGAEHIGDAYCEGRAAVIGVQGTFVVRLVE